MKKCSWVNTQAILLLALIISVQPRQFFFQMKYVSFLLKEWNKFCLIMQVLVQTVTGPRSTWRCWKCSLQIPSYKFDEEKKEGPCEGETPPPLPKVWSCKITLRWENNYQVLNVFSTEAPWYTAHTLSGHTQQKTSPKHRLSAWGCQLLMSCKDDHKAPFLLTGQWLKAITQPSRSLDLLWLLQSLFQLYCVNYFYNKHLFFSKGICLMSWEHCKQFIALNTITATLIRGGKFSS